MYEYMQRHFCTGLESVCQSKLKTSMIFESETRMCGRKQTSQSAHRCFLIFYIYDYIPFKGKGTQRKQKNHIQVCAKDTEEYDAYASHVNARRRYKRQRKNSCVAWNMDE